MHRSPIASLKTLVVMALLASGALAANAATKSTGTVLQPPAPPVAASYLVASRVAGEVYVCNVAPSTTCFPVKLVTLGTTKLEPALSKQLADAVALTSQLVRDPAHHDDGVLVRSVSEECHLNCWDVYYGCAAGCSELGCYDYCSGIGAACAEDCCQLFPDADLC